MSHYDELQMLKGMTSRMGVLHSAQVLQLECWGHIVFSIFNIPEWELYAEIDKKTIRYECDPAIPLKLNKKGIEVFDALKKWINELLGEEWNLTVTTPERVLY